jgi:RNA polymerase sigma-70 factor (sigma-E family)
VRDRTARFSEFVAARYNVLIRSAYLMTGDAGQAEDVVQAALFKTFLAWDRLSADAAALNYTRTTVVRLLGRWSRRRSAGEVVGITLDRDDVGEVADIGQSVDVRRALATLPWAQRAVLVLRYFDDLSEIETARVLNCSPGTVKSRSSRGLQALRASGLLRSEPIAKDAHDG